MGEDEKNWYDPELVQTSISMCDTTLQELRVAYTRQAPYDDGHRSFDQFVEDVLFSGLSADLGARAYEKLSNEVNKEFLRAEREAKERKASMLREPPPEPGQ